MPDVLPPVVALDLSGALLGAIGSAWNQKAGGGSINMDKVYLAAGIGAVTGSTGIGGRIGRFLTKGF
ncbi:MAG: hypothetical protein ICV66_07080 [Chitinophagaceae bacterium]|nr:hypothetical protein [Chitinophagaceae bacterium]